MKADKRNRVKVLKTPPVNLILLHGADAGGIADAAAGLLAQGRVDRLTAAEVKADPGQLRRAGGDLFGAIAGLRVDEVDDTLAKPVGDLLDAGGPEVRIVLRAAHLKASSKLRKLVEGHKKGIAVQLPTPDSTALAALTRDYAKTNGVAFDDDAIALLANRLPPDSAAARRELDKLTLYAGERTIDVACVRRAVDDAAEETIDHAIAAAFDGDPDGTARAWARLSADGAPVMQLIRAAAIHARHLLALDIARQEGSTPAKAVATLKPPAFGARRDALIRQAGRWQAPSLLRALEHIDAAELAQKHGGQDPVLTGRHLYWTLAMHGRSLSRNRR